MHCSWSFVIFAKSSTIGCRTLFLLSFFSFTVRPSFPCSFLCFSSSCFPNLTVWMCHPSAAFEPNFHVCLSFFYLLLISTVLFAAFHTIHPLSTCILACCLRSSVLLPLLSAFPHFCEIVALDSSFAFICSCSCHFLHCSVAH